MSLTEIMLDYIVVFLTGGNQKKIQIYDLGLFNWQRLIN